jgi:hypothetical protein
MLDVFILLGHAGNRRVLSATLLSILSFAAMLAGPTEAASVDGLVASWRFDGTLHDAADEALGIGDSAGAPSAGSRLRGYLDELALWSRALDDREIAARYATRAKLLERLEADRRQEEADRRGPIGNRPRQRYCWPTCTPDEIWRA